MPNKFVNKYIDYSQDGKILEIKSFNELGNIIEAQYNFKQDTLRLVYKYSPAKQNKFETITINEKESKTVFQYSDVSWFDDENNFPLPFQIQKPTEKRNGHSFDFTNIYFTIFLLSFLPLVL